MRRCGRLRQHTSSSGRPQNHSQAGIWSIRPDGTGRPESLGSGNFFGEIALLEPVEQIATVTAAAPLKVLVFSKRAFKAVLETDPEIERKLLYAVARRVLDISGDLTSDD